MVLVSLAFPPFPGMVADAVLPLGEGERKLHKEFRAADMLATDSNELRNLARAQERYHRRRERWFEEAYPIINQTQETLGEAQARHGLSGIFAA